MKKLLYLGIVLMFASCGSNESESAAELESATSNESESVELKKDENGEVMNGEEKVLNSNDVLIKINNYEDGELSRVEYFDNSKILCTTEWFDNGKIESREDYHGNGGEGGLTITYYNENGEILNIETVNNNESD